MVWPTSHMGRALGSVFRGLKVHCKVKVEKNALQGYKILKKEEIWRPKGRNSLKKGWKI